MDTHNPYCSPQADCTAEVYLQSEVFLGTTLAWFVDRFEFFVPEITEVTHQVISFYEGAGARLVAREPLTFWRGNWWSTLLGPEHRARQRIVVRVHPTACRVDVEYHINMILPARIFYHSQRETMRLATELGAVHPETLRER
ncbi:hypothetical protein AB1K70_14900 [Bremerella sp. JC770]|uniref:hypothetical protein n=1 Tax=Bremerella sp. JC770 TaxID=3232137 RepID=UPI003458903A